MNLSSVMAIYTLGDLLWADFWHRFPQLRFALTEGDIGWIPYFLWRAEHTLDRHNGWMRHEQPQGLSPTRAVPRAHPVLLHQRPRRREAARRVQRRQRVLGVRLPALRQLVAERARAAARSCSPASTPTSSPQITHRNAMRHYQFDPFAHRPPERCTAGGAAGRGARRRHRDPRRAGRPTSATSRPGSVSPSADASTAR